MISNVLRVITMGKPIKHSCDIFSNLCLRSHRFALPNLKKGVSKCTKLSKPSKLILFYKISMCALLWLYQNMLEERLLLDAIDHRRGTKINT